MTKTRLSERHDAPPRGSRLARLTANPVRLRGRAWLATALVSMLGGVSYGFGAGSWATVVVGVTWVAMPFLALGIALGDAFFVRHGRAGRRLTLTGLAAVAVALGTCGALASIMDAADSMGRSGFVAALYTLLFGAVAALVAALLALGIGRGEGYLSRKIQAVDDDGW